MRACKDGGWGDECEADKREKDERKRERERERRWGKGMHKAYVRTVCVCVCVCVTVRRIECKSLHRSLNGSYHMSNSSLSLHIRTHTPFPPFDEND